ncbi:MAG: efflux transporter periplasmic adaptor subunit, partial [Pricia sp.]|nr:efflux transporter periplasmic adaptor subunit [Pricia sp.]
MKITKFTLLLVSTLILVGCGENAENVTKELSEGTEVSKGYIHISQKQFESSGMTLGSLEEKSFPITVQTNGMIDVPPENKAVVSATMG